MSTRHRRILSALAGGDQAWEVPGKAYFSQFNEATGRDGRVRPDELLELERRGWVRRVSHPPEAHRLDFWAITDAGRAELAPARMGPVREGRLAARARSRRPA